MSLEGLSENLGQILDRITSASRRAGRSPDEITLVAVTKKQTSQVVKQAFDAGLLNFGENYVQEASDKREALANHGCRWHLIGHLQTNKSRAAVDIFDLIQSVDSVRLARQVAKQAETRGKTQNILLQVHLGDESTKTGFSPDVVIEAAHEILGTPGVVLQGLMGIAPQHEDPRRYFRILRGLFESLPGTSQMILSMGMTGDFETAIEEGATMVRIGTALFGARVAVESAETLA